MDHGPSTALMNITLFEAGEFGGLLPVSRASPVLLKGKWKQSATLARNTWTPRAVQELTGYISRSASKTFAGAPNGNFRENICSEDDLRTRIFGTFVVKFLACLPLLRFSNIYKMV